MAGYVYILYSSSRDRYYIGSTTKLLEERLGEHNSGRTRSTKFGIPWDMKYTEAFNTYKEAYNREQEIKQKKRRSYIEWLIRQSKG